ncbi:MAG TPA: sigma 54-interacting transcriptional regulator [Candidatus Tectomicrobia bacterium]|jgi:Nif-specific regulatory protein
MANPTGEIKQLPTLVEVSQTLASTLNLEAALHRILEILERQHGMVPSMVTLLRDASSELAIAVANGLPAHGMQARYNVGEGITGRVVESGKPIIVPQVSHEPLFLNRAGQRRNLRTQERTFICVPVIINRRPVGALGVDLRFKQDRDYDRELHFLQVVASMIAQAINIHHLAEAERQRLRDENRHLREELRERYDFANIVGNSRSMRQVYEQITQVAPTNTTALIRGESGTGKELIAHAIHYNSPRAKQPFIKVSCAALPETLIEAELFGHEKGAFTGAQALKKGRFELADGGTLFLDEIGELSLATQVKLLRVLQERAFERLGGTSTIKVNVRLLAATNRNLEQAIATGALREDLYYRLNVFSICIPPLRDRKTDILLLAEHFLEKYTLEHGKHIKRISTPAIDMLTSYHWPGNVRELENTMARAVLVCSDNVIHGYHLPPTLQTAEASGTVVRTSLMDAVAAYEKELIQDALKTTRGNRARAAKLLDTTERIIGYKVRKYAIDCRRYRS